MKILFINTPLQDYGKVKKENYDAMSPIGLGYLTTIVKKLGYEANLLDAEKLGLSVKEIIKIANEYDVICINLLSPTLDLSKKIISKIKNKRIIVGGPHATMCPDVIKELKNVDILVKGEGEETIKEIFSKKQFNKIKGISYRENKKIHHNPNRELIKDLDKLPFIDRKFFNEKKEISILTSRGCPYQCTFCAGSLVNGKIVRERSIKNIVDEIETLKIKNIHFIDNNFIYSKKKALEFIKELNKRKLKIKWRALIRINTINDLGKEVLQKLRKSGLYMITFGIESGCQRILNLIKKNITLKEIRKAIKLCREVGIKTKSYFMLGFPTETKEEMQETINFASELNSDITCFVTVKAYPGTELYNNLKNKRKWLKYKQLNTMLRLDNKEKKYLQKKGININKFAVYGTISKHSLCDISSNKMINVLRQAYKNCYFGDKNEGFHSI